MTAVRDAEAEAHGDSAFAAPTLAEEPKKRRGRSKQSHAAKDKRKRRRNAENPSAAPDGPAALGHTDGSGADSKARCTTRLREQLGEGPRGGGGSAAPDRPAASDHAGGRGADDEA